MKRKKYQQPVTEVVAAAPIEMIAASLLNEAETDTTGVFEDEGTNPIIGLSRPFDL
jgi:hypothetical protein